ncbi:hypothetical protein V6N11_018237 [Hibiscus sabdariffa]|uniref:Uncharacterized protein n=1 Tax=Hibiscus sabdariffa TaxID=183260 RepID=A0ABR2T7B5_9ROSI
MWVTGSMVLLSFSNMALIGSLLSSNEVWSTWFGCLEEWSASVLHESRRAWISISSLLIHLWSKVSFCKIVGLRGSYLRVGAATEEPSSFMWAQVLIETTVRGQIDEVVGISSHNRFFIVVQEADLVWVLAVEQHEVEDGSKLGDKSQDTSVASSGSHSVWGTRWGVVTVLAQESAMGSRLQWAYFRWRLCSSKVPGLALGDNCVTSSLAAVLGGDGAALALIIGYVSGGFRKVTSVNTLVEALGSMAQRHVIVAARSMRGRRHPAKGNCLVETGVDVVNASLMDSGI